MNRSGNRSRKGKSLIGGGRRGEWPRFSGWCVLLLLASMALNQAQVPLLLNYQGRIVLGGTNYDGTAHFKFALVDNGGAQSFWSNDASSSNGAEPSSAVPLTVSRGFYNVLLGDTALANMTQPVTASIFSVTNVWLRVWFSDGLAAYRLLTPDQRVVSVGYALMAANVADETITLGKLAPALAAQITALTSQVAQLSNTVASLSSGGETRVSTDPADTGLAAGGFAKFTSAPAPAWINGSVTEAPSARTGHTAVWTGQEMLVWGGGVGAGFYSGAGGIYQPQLDQWTAISTIDAPAARSGHGAVWSGTEMILWGGFSTAGYLGTGGRFTPGTQQWNAMSDTSAPTARDGHTAIWTGSRLVIWGGRNSTGLLSDGALYNPVANTWAALASANPPPARTGASAIWTGSSLIVWGGDGAASELGDGAELSFDAGGAPLPWQTVATENAPSPRSGHTAVWTGGKMIVWGGRQGSTILGNGAEYNPATGVWTSLPATGAPSSRHGHLAVWTGTEMVIQGGETASGAVASGAAYEPGTAQWRTLENGGSPLARTGAASVWTGTELILFGGRSNGQLVGSLQRLVPQPAWHFYRKL
jgi:hypothetical protein